jgi:hypothetical protein
MMRALQVSYDGMILARAGTPDATMLTLSLAWPIDETWPRLNIGGMNKYADHRMSHTHWLMEYALPGRVLELRLIETGSMTPPQEERFTDTEDYRAEQAEFVSTLTGPLPPQPSMERLAPHASLTLHLPGVDMTVANVGDGREWLFFSCLWSDHAPDECWISLTSKGREEIQARRAGRDWFRGKLKLGEGCRIDIGSRGVD